MLKFNKIWLTPKGKWKVKVYVDEGKTLFNEIEKDDLLDLIDVLNHISYNNTGINFEGRDNLFNN